MPRIEVESGFRDRRTAKWLSTALWVALAGVLVVSLAAGVNLLRDA
jgi:hypothetical protein